MSREIRRLHRKQTQFTNFSSGQATKLPNQTESTEQNIADDSSKTLRRRRRPSDSSANTNYISNLPNQTESTKRNISEDSESVSADFVGATNSESPIGTNDINAIRAEFQEDTYYLHLAESDYDDDTHDWGGDSQHHSSDYWHFLGKYE